MQGVSPKIRKKGTIRFYVSGEVVNQVSYYHKNDMRKRIRTFTKEYFNLLDSCECYYIISPLLDEEKIDYLYEAHGMKALIKSNKKSYRGKAIKIKQTA